MPPARATAPAAFGLAVAAGLLLGVCVVQRFPALPAWPWSLALLCAGVAGWCRGGAWRIAGACAVGVALSCLHGNHALAQRIDATLAGTPQRIEVDVRGLPQHAADGLRFEARVVAADDDRLVGRRVRLAWFARGGAVVPEVPAGSRWHLRARLKPPRGLVNPGGFDAERRALEQRLAATGYVLPGDDTRRLQNGRGLDALRERLSSRIHAALPDGRGRFVAALALGDTRALDDHDWQVLRATGLTHLIAISGFHVGLVAGFGALLGRGLWFASPRLARRWPRPQGAAATALLLAAAYTALAGFALPTVRTLLMIAAALAATLARRRPSVVSSLSFATIAVLLVDPLSVLAPGFWLSFLGVAWLVWCLPRQLPGPAALATGFVHAQAVALIGLLPLTVWFFGQASLAGPLVNLVGIPWISLGVVPLALAGIVVSPLSPELAAMLWRLAAALMDTLWWALERVAAWPASLAWLPEPTLPALLLAFAGTAWLLLPRGVPGRSFGVLLLLPLLWPASPRPPEGALDLWLFDTGQGLSLLVRTPRHDLLYDAGPATPGGSDLGESVVVPALRALAVRRLARLVVSHGDADHAGGLDAVRRAIPHGPVLAPPGWAEAHGAAACLAGDTWTLDGLRFTFLHPPPFFPYLRNESSCVLRIDTAHGSVLLPGDIGRHVESRLATLPETQRRADVLLVPHHGSDSSSSLDFLAAVRPRLALLAVGHGNRFGLPKPRVLDRYARYGVPVLDTAGQGALHVRIDAGGVRVLRRLRLDDRRYWRPAGDAAGYAYGGPETRR